MFKAKRSPRQHRPKTSIEPRVTLATCWLIGSVSTTHCDGNIPASRVYRLRIIDVTNLAPGHQALAAEAGVGAQHDLDLGPALAQLRYHAADLFNQTGSRILISWPEPRTQQLVASEDLKRQIAVAAVVAVPPHGPRPIGGPGERTAPADGRKRGCRWRPDRARSRRVPRVRLDVEIDQQPVNGLGRVDDLVTIPCRPLPFEAFNYVWTTQLCHEKSGLLPLCLLACVTCCLPAVRNAA